MEISLSNFSNNSVVRRKTKKGENIITLIFYVCMVYYIDNVETHKYANI